MYEKIKVFFKKYKYYLASFGGILTSIVSVNYFRNRAIKRNLQRVNDQLSESDKLISKQQVTNNELTEQIKKSRNNVSELGSKLKDTKRTSQELDVINSELTDESKKVGSVLSDLRKFIDENSVGE